MIDPAVLRFTHSRIAPMFTGCHITLQQTLDDIVAGKYDVIAE